MTLCTSGKKSLFKTLMMSNSYVLMEQFRCYSLKSVISAIYVEKSSSRFWDSLYKVERYAELSRTRRPSVMLNFSDVTQAAAQMNTRNSFGPIGLVYGSNVWSAGPEIEKYHEFNIQISQRIYKIFLNSPVSTKRS